MQTSDFDYHLPPEQIAQTPAEPRDASRLLVLHRATGLLEHRIFRDIGAYLRPGDLLVANESRVIPARLFGEKVVTGGRVEALLLRPTADATGTLAAAPPPAETARLWEALVQPGRSLRPGTRVRFAAPQGGPVIEAEVVGRTEVGARVLRFSEPPGPWLDRFGILPLPPYIKQQPADPERYQTVYAQTRGSAAAPTAGLHFTPRLLAALRSKGVGFTTVTLHVGLDPFRPVQEDDPTTHPMHREWYELGAEAAAAITAARAAGGRIVAVGTTSVRVLETVARDQALGDPGHAPLAPGSGWTDLFIYPGFRFRLTDVLLTNFHLPRSTLLMLVSAFAGRDRILATYATAVQEGYRFFSFGDAMLIT
jgi:S-adenosylmethionine:tRNA ribosyltransferase-isomerase